MKQAITFAAGRPPPWLAVRQLLASGGFPVQVRMIDGELAFPDEEPSEKAGCVSGAGCGRVDSFFGFINGGGFTEDAVAHPAIHINLPACRQDLAGDPLTSRPGDAGRPKPGASYRVGEVREIREDRCPG
jgi:hypothetical protein